MGSLDYSRSGEVRGGNVDGKNLISMHKRIAMGETPKVSKTAKQTSSKKSSMLVSRPMRGATNNVGNMVS